MLRARLLGSALLALLVLCAGSARALTRRRHFEPDDLELEQPGILDFDFQAGPLHGSTNSPNHTVLPDFEIGLGLTREVELDVSGAFTFDRTGGTGHITADPLWVATKLGLLDELDDAGNTWAIGLEVGPRFPTIDAAGLGYGALALFGFTHHGWSVVLNAGGLIDPGTTILGEHTTSIVLGLDLNVPLDHRQLWSLQSELGSAYYLSSEPHELSFTLGATYAVTPRLDISLTALTGFLPNTDHAGLLLGVSPQVGLW